MPAKPRKRRDSGDVRQRKVELWAGVRVAAAMVDHPSTGPELKLRAISALGTSGAVDARLLESSEIAALAERLAVLEARLAAVDHVVEGAHANGRGMGRH